MADTIASVELALDCGCDLGEGPIWDPRKGVLHFVDINRNAIHTFNPVSNQHSVLTLPEPVGSVALTSDADCLLAATQRTIWLVRIRGDTSGPIRSLVEVPESHGIDSMRFNDGKVTPGGAFLVGRMHSGWRQGNPGLVYALYPNTSILKEILTPQEVGLPNGMAWSADKRTCYFVDSARKTITAYETDDFGVPRRDQPHNSDSLLCGRIVFPAAESESAYVPDGMTIDADGNLWMVPAETGSVVCIRPSDAQEIRRVQLPVKRPTSCVFGGPDMGDLYVTTRAETGDSASKHHGGLFRVRIPGIRGKGPEFIFPL